MRVVAMWYIEGNAQVETAGPHLLYVAVSSVLWLYASLGVVGNDNAHNEINTSLLQLQS